jgi:hypothetical protein
LCIVVVVVVRKAKEEEENMMSKASNVCKRSSIPSSALAPVAARRSVAVRATADKSDIQVDQSTVTTRRAALSLFAGASVLAGNVAPSLAAYGEAANVFGAKTGNFTGFTPYEGDGYTLLLPAKWNPSKEKDFPGTDLRYEDNADVVNNLVVTINPTSKSKISDYGSQDEFLNQVTYLLGNSTLQTGFESKSEGGFKANTIAAASVLSVQTTKDKAGKDYYMYEILTRTADGDEGGRHQLIKATVSKGNLYIIKVQAGDKRWFKGEKSFCLGTWESFTVA